VAEQNRNHELCVMSSEFIWSEQKEPHFSRRKEIMKEHPEVKKLFGVDRSLKYKTTLAVLVQLAIPFFLPDNPWVWAVVIFFVGATLSHVFFLGIHEITHNLAFKKEAHNNFLAIFVNLPAVFPFAMAFKFYHAEHHWKQGSDADDTDIPSEFEARVFTGYFGKFIWMIFQLVFYAIRPVFMKPLKVDKWLVLNVVAQIAFDVLFFYFAGWQGLLYLVLSMVVSGGLHPIAGHFISEHYVFEEDQETYSYYGWLNRLTFNVGYHNEHHDFPTIPGSRLPKLHETAKEFYSEMKAYKSWTGVLWNFVFDKRVSLRSRIKRK
ncbi:MAG: fatty acid desaturase, partial [Cyclobacteriaceae bacterium]